MLPLECRISVADGKFASWRAQPARAACRNPPDHDEHSRKTTDGFFAVDSDWKLTYVNAEAERCRRKRMITWRPALGKIPELIGSIADQLREGSGRKVALKFEANDASDKTWFEVHAYPSNGGVSVSSGTSANERKRNRAAHTSKLESLGTLAGASPRLEQHSDGHFRQHGLAQIERR